MLSRLLKYFNTVQAIQLFQLLRFSAVFLVGIIFTKSALSLSDIGYFETFLFIATSVSFFWVSGLINGMLAQYPTYPEDEKPRLLFNSFLLIMGVNLLLVALLYVFAPTVTQVFTEQDTYPYYHWLLIYLLFNTPAFLIEYIFLLREQSKTLLVYGVLIFIGQVLACALPVWMGMGVEGAINGLIIFAAAKFLLLLVLIFQGGQYGLNLQAIKEHGALALPLGVSFFLSGSATMIDGIIISHYFDRETFAIFRYGARELPFVLLLANAFSNAAIPRVAANLPDSLGFIKSYSRQMMHWLFPVSALLLLGSSWFYPILFNPDFAASAPIFNIYLLLIVSRMLFPQTILNGLKQTRILMVSAIVEISLNIILSLILVQYFGLVGVAFATVIAHLADKVFLAIYCYVKNGIAPAAYTDLRFYFLYSLAIYAVYFSLSFFL